MWSMRVRRAVAIFLPSAVIATALCGLVYLVIQQDLRTGANDPQVQLAEDAVARLDAGAAPSDVVATTTTEIATSLAPFIVVYDAGGTVLATDGSLDGGPPRLPLGVLQAAMANGRNAVTWQPRTGVRSATVTIPWTGGAVTAGRSLRLVEERESSIQGLVALAWLVTLVASAAAAVVASSLWPTSLGTD
jgi:hypothetical protein